MNDRLASAEQWIEDTRRGVDTSPYAEHQAPLPSIPRAPVPATPEEVRGLCVYSNVLQCLSNCVTLKQTCDLLLKSFANVTAIYLATKLVLV